MNAAHQAPPASEKPNVYRNGTLVYTRRSLFVLFAWLLWGDFCFTLMETVVPSILPLKLRSLDSPNFLIGLIMTTLPGIFNVTITPWLSFKSDRYRSRWGRRLPFIISTLPFLTLALIAIAFSGDLGEWLHGRFFQDSIIGQAQLTIVLIALFAAAFDLFNMFVNTVYWYLFNDIVPKEWLGRFMGWFRLVGAFTAAGYNFLIFQYAESHMREIYLGAAALYAIGFGVMCLRIKEGEYPPPEDEGNQVGLIGKAKIFARECFSIRYYWDIFLAQTFQALAVCIGVFSIFFYRSLGLTLDHIGKLTGISAITVSLCFLFSGFLVDRWHPVRTAAYIAAFEVVIAWSNWTWLVVDSPPPWLLVILMTVYGALFGAALSAIKQTAEMVRLMFLFPHQQFGQFSGAMAMIRAAALVVGGILAGVYVDLWRRLFPEGDFAYRLNFLWQGIMISISFYFHYRLYRVWKRLGGAENYVAPTRSFEISSLPSGTSGDGKIQWRLVSVTGVALIGLLVCNLAWMGYYIWWDHQIYYAIVFAANFIFSIVLYFGFLLFLRHMERP